MTEAKKLKKKIRERAERTGESYATARRHVVARQKRQREENTARVASTARRATASGTVSEQRCVEKTGHGYDHWFAVLDRFGALRAGHTASARHLLEEHGVSAWYSQAITVAYERAKGARVLGQTSRGSYQFSVSRVLGTDFETARRALTRKRRREAWLDPAAGAVARRLSTALEQTRPRSGSGFVELRDRAGDGAEGLVVLRVSARDDGRSEVRVSHEQLADQHNVESFRAQWRALLDAFRSAVHAG